MLEMMFGAPTNAGKHVTLNDVCANCQWYTNDSVFWLVQLTCVMAVHNFLPFFKPNVISDGPTNGLKIRLLSNNNNILCSGDSSILYMTHSYHYLKTIQDLGYNIITSKLLSNAVCILNIENYMYEVEEQINI